MLAEGDCYKPKGSAFTAVPLSVLCRLEMHSNTVKWQKGRQIKVQLQSKQSISHFFPNFFPFSHSAACEIGPSYCWMREKGFLGSLLFDDSSGFCLPPHRCPFLIHWNWSPDICTFYFLPISHRIFWSQHCEWEIYYYSVQSQYIVSVWKTARGAATNEIRRGIFREYIGIDGIIFCCLCSDPET